MSLSAEQPALHQPRVTRHHEIDHEEHHGAGGQQSVDIAIGRQTKGIGYRQNRQGDESTKG